MRNGRGDSTVRILFNGVLAIVLLTLFLPACFRLSGEPSIDAEFTLIREIALMGIGEFAFTVDVKGVKDAAVVEFDNGMPSITLNGGKAESRFFANAGTGEVTLLVRDSRGAELLKKTFTIEETKSTFDVAAVEDKTGIYVLIDDYLIFYSLEYLEEMTFAEKVELLIEVLTVNDSYVIIDTPPFGAWIWDFETYPANPKYDLTQETLNMFDLPKYAMSFCEDSLFNVLNGRFLYGLEVVIAGNGSVVIAPEESIYEEGTEVSLTAEPAEGWLFEMWTGDATGSDTAIVITMDDDKAITANFKLERHSVAFFVSDSEGSVEGALVSFAGEERETDAQGKAEFYEISSGSKDYTITKLGYEDLAGNVIVDSDKTVDIVLAEKTYELTILVSGDGSISRSIEKERYNYGEIIELTAIPASGWNFSGWTGDLEGFLNPTSITMDGDKTATAHFVEHQYFVEVYASPEDGGAVSGGGAYGYGDEALLTAEASECYMFSGWYEDDQLVSEDREYRFDVFNDILIEARFVASVLSKDFEFILESAFLGCKYEVRLELDTAITKVRFIYPDIDPEEQTPIPEDAFPDEEGKVEITAFWTNRDAQAVIIVCYVGDEVVSQCEAVLSKENLAEFEITFNVRDKSGSVNGANVGFNGGSLQTDPQGRAVFSEVPVGNRAYTVSKSGYENSTGSVNVDSDKSVNVSLAKKTYTLSTNTVGQGSVSRNPDKSTYTHGEIVQLTAIPSTGWDFTGWSGDLSSTANPGNITMDSNKTVTATFTIKKYTIAASANPPAGGTANGGGTYNHGQAVNLVASASVGYEFVNWTENGVQVSTSSTYSFTATGNRTLVANFRLKIYTIAATAETGGNITPSGNVNVTHGSNQSFTITPNTGYNIEDVKVDGVLIGDVTNYTFNNVMSNHSIEVSFKLKAYTINATANPSAGGTANGGGTYNHGQTVNVVASANTGYEFVNWTENGVQVSANTAYSFTATGNRTLVANFSTQQETGGFKVANSWGIGGWEKVPDGFLFITYEAMKKNGVFCFITDPRDDYEPRAIAVFKISHSVRDDCDIYVGVGNPSSPSREKKFDDYYYRGGPFPFPDNKIVLDISEFLPFDNEAIYLKVYDRLKTSTTGTIEFFSVEIYSDYASKVPSAVYTSSQTPKSTANGSSVNVQIPNITVLSSPPFQLETFGAGISSALLERMKEQMGIYEEGRNYNEVINGYGTGLRPPSLEEWEEIRESWYEIIPFSPQDTLPAYVDHSSSIYFPPIGNQGNKGSCVAFSIGYYISTFYEARDRQWDLSSADWIGGYYGAPSTNYQDRIFSPDFIYHQINRGIDGGSAYQDALKVISNVGVSTWKEMPYNTSSCTSWPSESAWREAPRYRSYSNVMAIMQVTSDQHIQTLKSYLDSGYLVAISIDANKYSKMTQNDVWNSTNYTNPNTNHANTIVGYDDNMSSQ